ncbi:hypothetical protein EfmJHP38_34290 (plasmid) [Enterococcus faecium]|nr:hypothetical protein EfmJHP38_34290 [Enterococcus faecium]
MREKGDKTVRFTFDQLKDLSNYKATANVRFVEDLKATYEKILSLRFGRRSESGLSYDMFVMFTEFKINGDVENPYVDIRMGTLFFTTIQRATKWLCKDYVSSVKAIQTIQNQRFRIFLQRRLS